MTTPARDDDYRHSLAEELRRAVVETPDAPFLRMMTGEWSYHEIDEESTRLAHGLRHLGVERGDNVSLMLPNCAEFLVVWLALAKLGAVTAPVNTAFRGPALVAALDLVDSCILIAHDSLRDQWHPARPSLATIDTVVLVAASARDDEIAYATLLAPVASPEPFPDVGAGDPCLLLYTSGTTGPSKAALIPHRYVLVQAASVIEGLGLTPDDVLYCPYPMFHIDAAIMTIAPALLMRSVAAIGERFSVSRYWDEMRALEATVFDFMGATLTMLWKAPPSPRDREHKARLGWGVPMPEWAPRFEDRFGCRLVELYGSTEAGTFIYTPLDEPRRLGSCGKPLSRWDISLVDRDGFEVATGQPGELVVRPREPSIMMDGYYRNPAATAEAFRHLWFHTGDLLRRDADGFLYFVGRLKDMVRRRGENISAAEVELGIETHPDVLESAVIGVPSELTEEEVMACVVPRPDSQLTPRSLADHCAARMARFMVPRYIRFMTALPKTPTDKVEKFRLKADGITPDTWDREKPR